MKLTKYIPYLGLIILAVLMIWGFSLSGSPEYNRKASADWRRITDLNNIAQNTTSYFSEHKKLPDDLGQIPRLNYHTEWNLADPVTGKPYEYKRLSDDKYQLCADFELSSADMQGRLTDYEKEMAKDWPHSAGHHCFDLGNVIDD